MRRFLIGFIVGICSIGLVASVSASERREMLLLESVLEDLQRQWNELEHQQELVHETANSVRSALCLSGATKYCPQLPKFEIENEVEEIGSAYAITITSYNSECEQTDGGTLVRTKDLDDNILKNIGYIPTKGLCMSGKKILGDPCKGRRGSDLCILSRGGMKIIALSRELVGKGRHKPFKYGDYVLVRSQTEACSGVYRVEDTMNERFRMYGDIFYLNPEDNHGKCTGAVSKIILPE